MSQKKRGITLKSLDADDPGVRLLSQSDVDVDTDTLMDEVPEEFPSAQEIVWDILSELEQTLRLLPEAGEKPVPSQKDLFAESTE